MPKRSNLVDEIMVRSEYKYHTLGVWVFISCSSEGRGLGTGSYLLPGKRNLTWAGRSRTRGPPGGAAASPCRRRREASSGDAKRRSKWAPKSASVASTAAPRLRLAEQQHSSRFREARVDQQISRLGEGGTGARGASEGRGLRGGAEGGAGGGGAGGF